MKSLDKLLIILISFAFITAGLKAQSDVSTEFKDQMEVKVKPSKNAGSLENYHSTAPVIPAEEMIQQRIQTQVPGALEYSVNPGAGKSIDELCTPVYTYGCQYGDGFTSFAVEQIQNLNSGCADNTGVIGWSTYHLLGPAIMIPGFTYTFSLAVGYSNQHVNIWIDFNNDDILTADEMILFDYIAVAANQVYNVDITIPANATPGQHKMRVMCVYASTFTDPCGSYYYGEAEDYTVIVGVPAYGILQGTVTENTGGAPVQGALVSVANGMFTATTAANGSYQINNVLVGTWNVDVTKAGYNPASASVTITENITTTQNFALTAPTMNIAPATINVTVDPYGTATQSVTINNNGDGTLGWNASVEYLTEGNAGPNPFKGSQAYAVQIYPSPNSIVTFDTDNPGTFTTIAPTSLDPFAGDFGILSNTLMYVITYSSHTLYSIDVSTGIETMIAPVTGITAGHNISGMACDKTTGIMYVSSTDIAASHIYTVNLNTGALTLIGTTGIAGIIEIAIDGTGTMYAWDIVTDQSFTVDKTTGASTLLGSLGFDLNYAQGGNWDPVSDIIYLAAYTTAGQLMTLDKTTGALTLIGSFPGGAEVDALGFPGSAENWLTIAPSNGTVNAGGTFQMTVNFDALDLIAGTVKTANINFTSDPAVGTYTIPVSMTVGSLQFGHITGNITLGGSLPYNNGDVTQVLVEAGPYFAYPNASGFYDIAAYPGTYDVTATLYGYTGPTTAGVVVTENMITPNVNFTMPCINGIIGGTVTALTGGTPIAGATVSLLGTGFTTTTAANGTYQFIVEAGTYDVKVSASGYAAQTATGVVVGIQSTVTQNFVLEDLAGIIVIIDLDPTPNAALTSVIEGFFPGGLVVYTTSVTGYPLDQDVQTVFLLLGIYVNNHVLTAAEANVIKTWIDTYSGRNLYMEGGDTWYYDAQTPLHPYFNINPLSDGTGDLTQVDGIASFWGGFSWSYNGENNYIDLIAAVPPAINVLENPTVNYFCGVAYDAGTYKTVGASFELTGLNDGSTGFTMGVACVMGWFGYPVFAYGTLEGTVTESGTGNPIDGATITVGAVGTGTTLPNGTYSIPNLLTGNWTATCSKEGYNPASAPVIITENNTTTQNFALTAPTMNIAPATINVTVDPYGTATQSVTINNNGNGPLGWNASVEYLTEGKAGSNPFKGSQAYAVQIYPSPNSVVSFDTDNPGTFTTIASTSLDPFAGDFGILSNNLMYVITYTSSTLYSIDVNTGTETMIAPVTGITAGHNISGMACDKTTGIMYVSSTDISASHIYTVNLNTGALTLIGTTGIAGIIEIAIDGTGTMYAWDIVTDQSFTVDKTTGASTLLGALGFDLNYAQGGNWDPVSDIIYLAAYTSAGQLMTLDKTTGALTLIGSFPGGSEVDALGFPGAAENWLTITPSSGTIDAGGMFQMTVNFDALDFISGTVKTANINFTSNPAVGTYVIPVTMTVTGMIPAVNLSVTHSCTDVDLSWEMPTGGNPDSWNVYRDGNLIGNTTTMSHSDAMMMPQQEYCYQITAVYAGDESMPTQPGCITIPMPANLPPAGLDGTPNVPNPENITLTWNVPTGCLTPEGYNVYRNGDQVNMELITEQTYIDELFVSDLYQYQVSAVYYLGESDLSAPKFITFVYTGIDAFDAKKLQIFPNPASDMVYIKSNHLVRTVEILNNAGQSLEVRDINAAQFQVNVSQLESGLYYFKLITEEGSTLRKVLVE
jgi:hypothetical protein